jgi:hypothetical protein
LNTFQRARNKFSDSFPPSHVLRGRRNEKILDKTMSLGDDIIAKAINSGEPKLVGRLGGTEARVLECYLDVFKGKSWFDPFATIFSLVTFAKRLRQLNSGAGVYPINRKILRYFITQQFEALNDIDVLGCWGSTFTWVEKYGFKSAGNNIVSHHSVAPWVENFPTNSKSFQPWANSLNGKKILIISGFSRSFESQFNRIGDVFPKGIFPKIACSFILSPLSMGGLNDGKTWVDHLKRMKKEMEEVDFDVALISAGAYALPLAHHAKKLGKVGITCGGELQLFFGVVGKRWEHFEKVTRYRNEFWVRPSEDERPANWREIEDGCYW